MQENNNNNDAHGGDVPHDTPPLEAGSQIEISAHVEAHIGQIAMVFHEKVSPLVHIDVLHVAPTADSPYHSLITCGMSDAPMHLPDSIAPGSVPRHMELMITLPEDWRVTMDDFQDEQWYWPLRLLKQMARLPHERRTWLGRGHSVPCAEPFGADSPMQAPFSGVLIMPSPAVPDEFLNLPISQEKNIAFYSLIPLYEEEMQLKIDQGLDALLALFVEHEVDDLVEVGRVNVAL